ncbi:hypothetical protein RR45_GL000463 [Lactococcus chungangensis CAU 28 = DSM 22330]|uniref:Uncharacterized protein n=1 Tax=Pseudolactococcus chungangensis CAU 28 = DSM 22330 TaxID=1122154 RepID=A0ABX4I6C6_9LACT|nr:hypothetical protein RR45_GL000463 [Lactococcus chungangensis CAU 28 = DSM 22330]
MKASDTLSASSSNSIIFSSIINISFIISKIGDSDQPSKEFETKLVKQPDDSLKTIHHR